jgi:hypothetical protein
VSKDVTYWHNRVFGVTGKELCRELALDVLENTGGVDILLPFLISDDKKIAMRSSWVLATISETFPEALLSYREQLVEVLGKTSNESVIRSVLRSLSVIPVHTETMGELLNHCSDYLTDMSSAVAVKVHSMTIFYNITVIEPDLKTELQEIIYHLMQEGSGGIISRGRKILKNLDEI